MVCYKKGASAKESSECSLNQVKKCISLYYFINNFKVEWG